MAQKISQKWKDETEAAILSGSPIDVTTAFRQATQWLVITLSRCGIPYKLHNLGCGVTRITTDTTICPCCKRPLP